MMKKITCLIVAVFSLVLITSCENAGSPPSNTGSYQSNDYSDNSDNSSSESATKAWPYVLDEDDVSEQEVITVENLIAKNYLVVFDDSSSMGSVECSDGKTKLQAAKDAVINFSKLIPEGAYIGLETFWGADIPIRMLNASNRGVFEQTVNDIDDGGSTPLASAVRDGFMELTKQGIRQLGCGEFTLVIVTDGAADSASQLRKWINYVLENSPIQIHTIGFCIGSDHTLNQPGKTVYKAADNPDSLEEGLKDVLAEEETFDISEF